MGLLDGLFGGKNPDLPEMKPGDGTKESRLVVHKGNNPNDDWGWNYTQSAEGVVKEDALKNEVETQVNEKGETVEVTVVEAIPGCRSWAFVGAAPGEVRLVFADSNYKTRKTRAYDVYDLKVDKNLQIEVVAQGKTEQG